MDMQENRRAKLQQMANATSISEIARRTNRPISQICDVLKGRRGFGEKLARKLEVELGLSPGIQAKMASLSAARAQASVQLAQMQSMQREAARRETERLHRSSFSEVSEDEIEALCR